MKKQILLVDDEKDIVEFVKYNLELEGYEVLTAFNGIEALHKVTPSLSLIILDIMMPKLDGYEVFKKIRSNKAYDSIPIIFLTAKSSEVDEIKALDLGASDFIKKPISPSRLMARVKSNIRKSEEKESKQHNVILEFGPIVIDKEKYIVKIDRTVKIFPRKEFELLFYLIQNKGSVQTRESLLKNVWGADVYVVDRTVDVHIRKIREKLEKYGDLIETIKGVGYKFKDEI